jgi:hypothetical protein
MRIPHWRNHSRRRLSGNLDEAGSQSIEYRPVAFIWRGNSFFSRMYSCLNLLPSFFHLFVGDSG